MVRYDRNDRPAYESETFLRVFDFIQRSTNGWRVLHAMMDISIELFIEYPIHMNIKCMCTPTHSQPASITIDRRHLYNHQKYTSTEHTREILISGSSTPSAHRATSVVVGSTMQCVEVMEQRKQYTRVK